MAKNSSNKLYYLYKRIKYNILILCAFNKREGHKEKDLTPQGAYVGMCLCIINEQADSPLGQSLYCIQTDYDPEPDDYFHDL